MPGAYILSDWGGLKLITVESIMLISKSDLQEASKALSKNDISQLVEWLTLKDDNVRYQALQLLQALTGEILDKKSKKQIEALL